MKQQNIESFLRENRPQVKENPTFLLEVQQKMRAVDGIRHEVDRQRRSGRAILALTLATGIIIGAFIIAFIYIYPVDPDSVWQETGSGIRAFFNCSKHYLPLPIAGLAIISVILQGQHKNSYMKL